MSILESFQSFAVITGLSFVTLGVAAKVFVEKGIEKTLGLALDRRLAEFKSQQDRLLADYRLGLDKALAEYKSALDANLADRKLNLDKNLTDYKSTLDVALEKNRQDWSRQFEATKIENTIIGKRYDSAERSCKELNLLLSKIRIELNTFSDVEANITFGKLEHGFHSGQRKEFERLRQPLEGSSDLFSAYSLRLSQILAPKTMRSIFEHLEFKSKKSDVLGLYLKTWEMVIVQLNALLNLSSTHEFWDPRSRYLQRANQWAAHDSTQLVEFLKLCAREKASPNQQQFFLVLELSDGYEQFWQSEPGVVQSPLAVNPDNISPIPTHGEASDRSTGLAPILSALPQLEG